MNKNFLGLLFLFGIIFLSGCVSININQELKRNGAMNFNLSIASQYPTLTSGLVESLRVNPSVFNKFTFYETDEKITYSFKNINFYSEELFNYSASQNIESEETTETIFSKIFNKSKYSFQETFSFPYYIYNYTIDFSGDFVNELEQEEIDGEYDLSSYLNPYSGLDEMEMLNSMIDLTYDLKVFGEIIETNGIHLGKDKVKFNINFGNESYYYVTFKDFFLINWIGKIFG